MSDEEKNKMIGQVSAMSLIANLKPGSAPAYKAALARAQAMPNGELFKKIPTIHFARWVIFDNDTRLFFESNFDGHWIDYIRDFSVNAPDAMDGAFQACEGYPEKGCRDFEAFKKFVLDHEVPTNLFYAAYPNASVRAIQRALAVKELTDDFVRKLD